MTPQGVFDYSAFTLSEMREDLAEQVSDFVFNSGWSVFQEALDALEDETLVEAAARVTAAPPQALVKTMNALLEHQDALRVSRQHRELLDEAVRQLQEVAGVPRG